MPTADHPTPPPAARPSPHPSAPDVETRLRLDALGELAGAVAHDLNNLLQILSGCCDQLRGQLPADSPGQTTIDQMALATAHAADLAASVLAAARHVEIERRVFDLEPAISRLRGLVQRAVGPRVRVEIELSGAPTPVRMNDADIGQILLNLATNARDAMPEGGVLRISTSLGSRPAAGGDDTHATPHLTLRVRDTGTGMTPAVRERAFERYFTTKAIGRGSGQGLAIVQSIVRQRGGVVALHSGEGEGTEFVIELPLADETPAARPAAAAEVETPSGRDETVLVVDDDPEIREIVIAMLDGLGYAAREAASPQDALAAVGARPPQLLITDVDMPGLSGLELARRVAAVSPSTRVLAMSGDVTDLAAGAPAGVAFLQKPFSRQALARAVREVLEARPDAASPV